MIETLISSKTRVKLLMKFFLNSNTRSYLRGLEQEFGDSTNSIRIELNRMEKAGMLTSEVEGNKRYFRANQEHPLFDELHNIVLKHIGIDRVINQVVHRLGEVRRVYLAGRFARGLDSPVIDLIMIGAVDLEYLVGLIQRAEEMINRKIRYVIYSEEELKSIEWGQFDPEPLLLWAAKIE